MKTYRNRLGVRARMNTVLPRFHQLFGRDAPFGALDRQDIITILSDEKWYGDGPPKWKRAPTAEEYQEKWKLAVYRLGKPQYQGQFSDGRRVAEKIRNCSPGNRCGSGGCYPCTRAFQRWLIWAASLLYRRSIPGYEDVAFNFVFPAGQAHQFQLQSVSFDEIANECSEALERTGVVANGLLAFDISFNDDTEKFLKGRFVVRPAIYWQVHLYGIVRTTDREKVLAALQSLYPPNEKIHKPVKRKRRFDGSNYAISYLFKPEAWRRKPFWSTYFKKHDWKSRPKRLKAREQIEYLLVAHHLGFSRRLKLINLHPIKLQATPKRNRSVGLRITTPRRAPM